MSFFIAVISIFWIAGTIKLVLFWIYLWQLKNYHIGRFVDHFRTAKGKRIIFSYFTQFFVWRLKKPVFTAKAILLTGVVILITGGYLALIINTVVSAFDVLVALVIFNLLTPVIVSAVVLAVQPFFVMMRNGILKKATAKMAQFPNLKVIGITGSYGKTSTKEFLTTILSSKFNVLATPEHKNSEMGIAQTILNDLKPEHEIFIVEMGSYNKGGIKLLCDMVHPSIGIVTGVNQQHLATFGSLENLLSAEGGEELVKSLPSNGLIILNGDNKYCLELYKKVQRINKKIYTVKKDFIDADIWTEEVTVTTDSLSFLVNSRQKEMVHVNVNILGKQHVQNLLGAMLIAKEFGMSLEEISKACNNIEQKQAGMTLKTGVHSINIIDSSYSSNPDGVMADLEYLAIFPGKKVMVMPCLIELGQKSIEAHIQIGKKIAEACDLAIITTKDKFKEIQMGAVMSGMKESQILLCDKPNEILAHITTFCKEGDVVLLEGRVPKELIRLLNAK